MAGSMAENWHKNGSASADDMAMKRWNALTFWKVFKTFSFPPC